MINRHKLDDRPSRWAGRALGVTVTVMLLVAGTATAATAATHRGHAKAHASHGAKSVIKIAGICDYTGPTPSPESCNMAKAYFNNYLDSKGGIDGHKVIYTTLDEADSASTAAQVGARAVEQLKVDAMVGGYGTYACTANARLYRSNHVYMLGGPEADIECWKSPNTRPMNAGPWVLDAMQINYFAKVKHFKNICLLESSSSPASLADGKNVIAVMQAADHVKTFGIPYAAGTPITPVASAAVAHGCQGFAASGTEPEQVALQRALGALNAFPKMKVITGVIYQSQPGEMGADGNGYLGMGGVTPYWENSTPELHLYHSLTHKYNIPEDSFSEYGFLAAQVFTKLVRGIKGPINRTSVGDALKNMKNVSGEGLEANNLSWNTVDTSGKLFVVKDGKWTAPSNGWISMNLSGAELKSDETGVPLGQIEHQMAHHSHHPKKAHARHKK